MIKKWNYKIQPDEEEAHRLAVEASVPLPIANILLQRNISTAEEVDKFYNPSLNDLHDPFLMKDMDVAIARIKNAMAHEEKIMVYGDYDVDGTTSVALVYGFLRHFHGPIFFYIPDRYKEGYGISQKGIDWAAQNDIRLIITLDCGIKAIDMTKYAATKGIDMIICDHHLPGDELPHAVAILDPKQHDCAYPYKDLSGCGVGFKLMQAFCHENHYDPDLLYDYLDLVAVSIAADIVPITGENRILAHHGLHKLKHFPRPGLEALLENAGIVKDSVNINSIVFGIGPRINASGRMDHAKTAVELLLTNDAHVAWKLSKDLNDQNNQRRDFDTRITQEALEMIENNIDSKELKTTVLFKNDWHKGVIGIVASRCLEKFYRPTIILTESNGKATGSARSVNGFDVYEAIAECSDLLDQYGGHMYAAGLTIDVSKIELFKDRFEKVVAQRITDDQLIPQIDIDTQLGFDNVSFSFFEHLRKMEPFGPGNMQPVFVTENIYTPMAPRVLKNVHLKLTVKEEGHESTHDAIAFGMGENAELIGSGMRFKMAYYVEENTFMGRTSLQLRVKDFKFD